MPPARVGPRRGAAVPPSTLVARHRAALRRIALGYPEAREDFPWGERVVKVRGKIFAFLGRDGERALSLTVKLPRSGLLALGLPQVAPTGYGLGGSGWISATLARGDEVPFHWLEQWIDESYRAVAPRRLVEQVGTRAPSGTPEPAATAPRRRRRRSPGDGSRPSRSTR